MEGDEDSKNADELAVKCTYRITDWCWRVFCKLTLTTRDAVKVRWSNYLVLGVGTVGCTGIVSEYSVSIVQGYPDTFSTVTHDQWLISQLRNFVCGHVVRPCRPIS